MFKSFKLRHKSNSADHALPLNGVEELEDRLLLAGDVELYELVPGAFGSVPAEFTDINQKLFFSAFSIGFGKELWLSDGTLAGTAMLKDILPGGGGPGQTGGSYPHVLTQVGPLLLFAANDGAVGDELWASDGTAANTILLKDINAGGGSNITEIAGLGPLGGRAVISAFDDRLFVGGKELWITDGTSGGTFQLRNINPFFNAINSNDGITDGRPYSSFPQDFTNVGGNIFFSAQNNVTGTFGGNSSINRELWFTDGTNNNNIPNEAKGTFIIELNPDPDVGSYPQDLIRHKGQLYFTANDGTNGRQIWRSNGTIDGTVMVTNIPGGFNPRNLASALGEVYFTADGGEGFEPWKTSVQIENTTALKAIPLGDLNPGPGDSNPDQFTEVGDKVFFAAYNAVVGKELWLTDGTAAGSVLVRDINDEPPITVARGSDPENLINFNGKLFFTAYTVDQGVELWRSDGTTKGTVIFEDINTKTDVGQPVGSYPAYSTLIRGVLYFRANDGITGDEFYKLGPLALATDIDDVINIEVLANKLSVDINGDVVLYNLNEPLTIDALDGVDTVNVILKDEDETVVFSEGLLTVTGENYSFAVSNAEFITVDAGSGDDTASFNDSSKDDLFVVSPGSGKMTGSGYSFTGDDFESISGFATTGKDRAVLNGSNDDDAFTGQKTRSVLSGPGYYSSASGFDKVEAFAMDGVADTARLYDSSGNDTYRGSDVMASLSGKNFSNIGYGFDKVLAYASGGKDSAYLKGTTGDDRLNAKPTKSTLSAAAFSQVVKRFERVIANSNGGSDTAIFKDSNRNDKMIGKANYSLLTGPGFYNRANGFAKIIANSTKGKDKLVLSDSAGNDTLTAKYGGARPFVLFAGSTFSVKATGFKTTIVSASQGTDTAKLFDSNKNDTYTGLKNTGKLKTSIGEVKVKNFDRVIATANNGGFDRIKNNKLTYTFVDKGSWEKIV